jgi:pimeloyl-ACP methyl ester carboxylesterase
MRKCVLSLVMGLSLVAARAVAAQRAAVDLDVPAADGAKVRATYYSPGKPGPGILLLHQCNMDRRSWASLAAAMVERGVHVLAIDYRGYGESAAASGRQYLASDIDSALATLVAQRGVDKDRLAAGGASCGVNNAVQLAKRTGRIKALVLLSGPTPEDGLAFLRTQPNTAIFAAASSEEDLAVSSLRTVVGTSSHPATTMRVLNNAGHGVPMFSADATLLPAIADWVASVMRPSLSGRWVVAQDSAPAGRGRGALGSPGSGWGSPLTVTQDSARLVVEYSFFSRYDMQPPFRFVYALNGAETTNAVMVGHGAQAQVSRVSWDGPTVVIHTTHLIANPAGTGDSLRVDVTRRLSLESPARLVVETTRAGVLGGASSISRTVYTKQ